MSDTQPTDPRWGRPDPTHDPRLLAHFRPRPDDVLITTAPKAGTTWMQQILHQARSGGDPHFRSIAEVVPWLERPLPGLDWRAQLAGYEALPGPRVFKTHCTAEQTPGLGELRVILTLRDPRDCCLSFYHHLHNLTDELLARSGHQRPVSLDAHVEQWLAGGAWLRNVGSWWPWRGHPRVLILRYADLKEDLGAGLDRILDFLGWSLTPMARERVLEYAGFAWMKAHDARFSRQLDGRPSFAPGRFIREGRVGGYRDALNPAQSARILARVRATLPEDCCAWLGLAD